MPGERPNAIFNIGSQHGNVSNVGGDMTVYGGQHYTALPADMIRRELGNIQGIISAMDLDPAARKAIAGLLADADRELGKSRHNAGKVGRPIERLTRLLRDIGAIAAGGAALIDPLLRIASCLGAAGQAIFHLVG
jgi:hypothetical protein